MGKVKTRLAKSLGNQKALHIYQQLVRFTRDITKAIAVEKQVWYSSFIEINDPVFKGDYLANIQCEGDLGERMKEAFSQAFSSGAEQVIIIGSDCGELDERTIRLAFEALKTNDVVIGPAIDGGYYLLGMNDFYPELFESIEWSTNSVYFQTRERMNQMQLSCFELPVLSDVDTAEDWEKVRNKFEFND